MTTALVHIGTHKTGTTATQSMLDCMRPSLRSAGIDVIDHKLVRAFAVSLWKAEEECNDEELSAARRVSDRIVAAISQSSCPLIVLSAEQFCGDPWCGYPQAAAVAHGLQRCLSDETIRVVLYLRSRDVFLQSLYSQSIKEGGTWSFGEFCLHVGFDAFDWSRLTATFMARLGNDAVIVRPYCDDVVADFFRHILHIDVPQLSFAYRANRRYSPEALAIARRCNRSMPRQVRNWVRAMLEALDRFRASRAPGQGNRTSNMESEHDLQLAQDVRVENEGGVTFQSHGVSREARTS